jgi:hypothetical protein
LTLDFTGTSQGAMHLASLQRNADINAEGLEAGYKNILIQR